MQVYDKKHQTDAMLFIHFFLFLEAGFHLVSQRRSDGLFAIFAFE